MELGITWSMFRRFGNRFDGFIQVRFFYKKLNLFTFLPIHLPRVNISHL